jgi:hypothetical protein
MNSRSYLLVGLLAFLASCGGSSSGGGSSNPPQPPTNSAPVVNAGADQTVNESTVVELAGGATDANNDPLTYSWTQTSGTTVTLNNSTARIAGFTAPQVSAGAPEDLIFRLSVSDGAGATTSDDTIVTVQEPAASVVLSGLVEYEFPPPNNSNPAKLCNGLDFRASAIMLRPVRGATVQIIDPNSNTLIASTVTAEDGIYSVMLDSNIDVRVRVIAELKRSGSPSWDVEVRNNVVDPLDLNPPPLGSRPKYFLDSSVLNTGDADLSRDLIAGTGNGGTGARAAAPFSVLDTIYEMMQLVVNADPAINMPALDAFWSPDNIRTAGPEGFPDVDTGELGSSFYSGNLNSLFLLGKEGVDTEEFDDHVIAHEWGHYFEDNFSRSDSIGGVHSIGNLLDMRVAFGEGFATALSGMGLDDPIYCDTFGNGGFDIDIEGENGGFAGWFNESSIMKVLYDLWDSDDEGGDAMSIGFGPIYDVMRGPQRTTPAFTSIFSFAEALKAQPNAEAVFIDAQLARESITGPGINLFGVGESNDGPVSPPDVLPVYRDITVGIPLRICSNSQFDAGRTGNKLSEVRYLKLGLLSQSTLTFTVDTANPTTTPSPGFDCVAEIDAHRPPNPPLPANSEVFTHSDPDFLVWRNGQAVAAGLSCQPNQEVTAPTSLSAGTYVVDLTEFRYADTRTNTPGGFPEQTCFDVAITP